LRGGRQSARQNRLSDRPDPGIRLKAAGLSRWA
jgi:hypothetical protein